MLVRRLRTLVPAGLAVGGIAVASVVLLASYRYQGQEARSVARGFVSPRTVYPLVVQDRQRQVVTVLPVWGPVLRVLAPQWSGTVTATGAVPGEVVSSGDNVVEIDGMWRMAVSTERPFFRALGSGDSGWDVRQLHRLLVELGYLDVEYDDSDKAGSATDRAVRLFASAQGFLGTATSFDPSWVLWLGDPQMTVANVDFSVGGRAPAPGEVVLESEPELRSLLLQLADGGPPTTKGRRSLDVDGSLLRLVDGEINAQALVVLGQSGVLGSRDGATIVGPGSDAPVVSGWLDLDDPVRGFQVPASAVRSGADQRTCVWVMVTGDSPALNFTALAVHVATGGASSVVVIGDLTDRSMVLVNASEALENAGCP